MAPFSVLNTIKRNPFIKRALKSSFVPGWNFGYHRKEKVNRENMTQFLRQESKKQSETRFAATLEGLLLPIKLDVQNFEI